jgi:hypothetical protein
MYSLNRGVHAAAGLLALVAMIVALQQLIPLTTQYDIGLLYNDRETLRVMRVSVAALDWRLVMVTLPTVVHHLIMAFQSDTAWSVYISRRFSLLRWTEYSITNTAMTLRIAVLCSVSDIGSLIQIGTTAVAIIGLGAIHEYMLQWSKGTAASRASINRVAWSVYGISSWLFVAQWSIILGWFLNAVAQADDKPPEWVSAVVAFVLLLDCGFPIVAMVNAMWPETRYERIDLAYAILSLSVKQFYMYQLIFGYVNFDQPASTTLPPPTLPMRPTWPLG